MSVTLSVATRYSFADGHDFGAAGAYEYLAGRAHFAVDPKAPDLQAVTDLGLAPVDKDGKVVFSADFALLKPVDLKRGNKRLFFDYGNRGNKRCLQFFNDAVGASEPRTLEHAGNGYFMRRGYTVGWLAWQGDLYPGEGRMLIDVPVATDNGKPVTGPVRVEYIAVEQGVQCMPLSGQAAARSYPAVSGDTRQAKLTRRRYADSERVAIPADAWQFARVEFGTTVDGGGRERAVIPCDTHIYIEAGFEPGWIYELIYTGRDPMVLGLGHVAVRDFISFVKHDAGAGNPLAGGVEKAYAWGRSQTGRCIRDFVYLGFNADAKGRKAFDGVIPHVAGGGKMWMNQRFAAIMPLPGQEYENHFTPVDVFPFSYATTTDHLTGRKDGIAKRPETDPLIIQTDTATEYWQRRGSLTLTDTEGNDVAMPANVRVYLWASTQHYADPLMKQPPRGICVYPANVVWSSMLFRATLDMMDRWASGKGEPPPSKVPSRKDGTLVTAEEWRKRYPTIPGAIVPKGPSTCELLDFGPDVERGLLKEPPVVHKDKLYAVMVPVTDADGNDVPGIRAPMVQAPLATYNGWSMRAPGHGYGAMGPIVGSTILFPETPEARAASGDPRPSILERYKDKAAYVAAIEAAARKLVAEGFMLEEDVARCKTLAADWGRPRHEVKLT